VEEGGEERMEKTMNRCALESCKKKLALSDFPCKCSKKYCAEHRYAEAHACSFDYHLTAKQMLSTTMHLVIGKKIDPI